MPYSAKKSAAHRLLFDDLGDDECTPTSKDTIQMNIKDGLEISFGQKLMEQAEERGIHYKLTDEERKEIEDEMAANGVENLCRCTQADFNDPAIEVRQKKAVMVNLYFEYGGDWAKVFRDNRSVSRRTMAVYWRDDVFKNYIEALSPILTLEARGVVVHVMKDGVDEKARLAAALRWLEAEDAKKWDRGVRKQIIANKGSIESALFTRVVSDSEFINTYIKDKLNKLPDDVRVALAQTLETKPAAAESRPLPDLNPSTRIQLADINKLTDPFSEMEEDDEIQTD